MKSKRTTPAHHERPTRTRHLVLAIVVALGAWAFLSQGLFESRLAAYRLEMASDSSPFISSVLGRNSAEEEPVEEAAISTEEAAISTAVLVEVVQAQPAEIPDEITVEAEPVTSEGAEDGDAVATTSTSSSTSTAPRSTTAGPAAITTPTTVRSPQVTVRPTTTRPVSTRPITTRPPTTTTTVAPTTTVPTTTAPTTTTTAAPTTTTTTTAAPTTTTTAAPTVTTTSTTTTTKAPPVDEPVGDEAVEEQPATGPTPLGVE